MASDEAIYLNKQDRRILQELIRKGRAGNGSKRPTPTRRLPRGAGVAGNIIRATVNEPTGVLSGDPTFSVDNAVPIVGSAPSDGTATAQNTYSEAFADNEPVLLFQRRDSGNWETEKSGGSSYTPVVLFELTQDKAYADTAKLAKPLNAAGVVDTGAAAFYVLDANGNHYGKAPAGADRGYQGTAILATDDHASSGLPGYRIITMEQPAHLLTGILSGSYSVGGTTFTPSTTQIWGRAERGRRLPATGDITVMDDDDVASAAVSGDKWLIAWNEAAANYTFVVPMEPATGSTTLVSAMITGNVPAMAHADLDGSLITSEAGISASGVAYILKWLPSLPPRREQNTASFPTPLFVVNDSETAISASTSEAVIYEGYLQTFLDAEEAEVVCFVPVREDRRSVPLFDRTKKQHIKSDASTGAYDHQEIGPCTA
jgi:acyl dehydratase